MVHRVEPSGIKGNKPNPDKTKQRNNNHDTSCGAKSYLSMLCGLIYLIGV